MKREDNTKLKGNIKLRHTDNIMAKKSTNQVGIQLQ